MQQEAVPLTVPQPFRLPFLLLELSELGGAILKALPYLLYLLELSELGGAILT